MVPKSSETKMKAVVLHQQFEQQNRSFLLLHSLNQFAQFERSNTAINNASSYAQMLQEMHIRNVVRL